MKTEGSGEGMGRQILNVEDRQEQEREQNRVVAVALAELINRHNVAWHKGVPVWEVDRIEDMPEASMRIRARCTLGRSELMAMNDDQLTDYAHEGTIVGKVVHGDAPPWIMALCTCLIGLGVMCTGAALLDVLFGVHFSGLPDFPGLIKL